MAAKITKDMLIADVVQKFPQVVPTLLMSGMGCIGCGISQAESLEMGATAHGIDVDDLLMALNEDLEAYEEGLKKLEEEKKAAQKTEA